MYYFFEHGTFDIFCSLNVENFGECCESQWVCVHQRIALYKSYLLLLSIIIIIALLCTVQLTEKEEEQTAGLHGASVQIIWRRLAYSDLPHRLSLTSGLISQHNLTLSLPKTSFCTVSLLSGLISQHNLTLSWPKISFCRFWFPRKIVYFWGNFPKESTSGLLQHQTHYTSLSCQHSSKHWK